MLLLFMSLCQCFPWIGAQQGLLCEGCFSSSHRASTIFLLQLFYITCWSYWYSIFAAWFYFELCAPVVFGEGSNSWNKLKSPIKTSHIIVINSSKDIFRHYGNTTSKNANKANTFLIHLYLQQNTVLLEREWTFFLACLLNERKKNDEPWYFIIIFLIYIIIFVCVSFSISDGII